VLIDLPANSEADESDTRRLIPNMTLGLMEWLVRFSRRTGLTHWFAIMEPQLIRLHARMGIHFVPIGDLVDYHGVRQPCYAEVESMLRRIDEERPDVWGLVAKPSERLKIFKAGRG
jgi:N-acyl amino acid synthase of PEP-CTERM/exosortase system